MTQPLYIGVDGGATKCIVRVEDAAGHLLGQQTTGSANIRISVEQTWASIHSALQAILTPLAITTSQTQYLLHAGMGLAGIEMQEAYQAFMTYQHGFKTLIVSSDAHTACLGAHDGVDGAVIIAGTGVVGYQIQARHATKVGGWGFPQDDEGGGAWLGLEAVKLTLHVQDGRSAKSGLSAAVYAHFDFDLAKLISWTNQANSTAFAQLAPIVIKQAQNGDPVAIKLLQRAAAHIDRIGSALAAAQPDHTRTLACALVGGVAPYLEPYLEPALRARLRPCLHSPVAGAILLVKQHLSRSGIEQ